MSLKIAVFGLGSIGLRHVHNLIELGVSPDSILGVDPRVGESGLSFAPIQATDTADLAWSWKPDVALICAPPVAHASLICRAMEEGVHCFTEKPLSLGIADTRVIIRERTTGIRKACFIGYQLRWQLDDMLTPPVRCITWECSQDIRQWPSTYQKDVLLEFSHEIDAAVYMFGPVEKVSAREYVNGWEIWLRHLNGLSEILLNPYAKDYVREATSNGETLWEFSREKNDQAYKQELDAFLHHVETGEPADDRLCTLAQATHVMQIVEACKESAMLCKVVRL
jgi:predicted dehydrogenase